MSKKLISVVLALVLVLSSFAVSAFAGIGDYAYEEVNEETGEIPYNQTWTLGTPDDTDGDGEWTVDVSLETDYRVGAIQFVIANADKNAVLADVVINTGVFGNKATVEFSPDGKVLIVPKPSSAADKGPELTDGPVIATLYYTLKSGASSAKIAIDNKPKNEEFVDGTLIAVRMSDDSLVSGTSIYGQNVLSTGEEQTIGSAAAADPVLKAVEGSTGFVDETNKYVYGVPKNTTDLTTYFTVENGSFVMEANAGGYTNGTGSTLVVKNNNGEEAGRYTLIVFGDVNGDGNVTATDYTAVANKVFGGTIEDGAPMFAANVNGDTGVTATDYTAILNHVFGGDISTNPYAA